MQSSKNVALKKKQLPKKRKTLFRLIGIHETDHVPIRQRAEKNGISIAELIHRVATGKEKGLE